VDRPTTQNIIGKENTGQRNELGERNAPVRPAKLYLRSLTDIATAVRPSSPNGDLLHFKASVSTSNNKICSAYSMFDCGTSLCHVDTAYAKSLGLKHRLCRRMRISVPGEEKGD
jgi:hypothetical protein